MGRIMGRIMGTLLCTRCLSVYLWTVDSKISEIYKSYRVRTCVRTQEIFEKLLFLLSTVHSRNH